MDKKKNVHEGHRERMRKRFKNDRFVGWSKHEVLEYLLYNVYQRMNTNEIAHNMINASGGSIAGVLSNADGDSLKMIKNVGDKGIEFLRTLRAFIEYCNNEAVQQYSYYVTKDNFLDIVQMYNFSPDSEDILLLCLDSKMKILYGYTVAQVSTANFAGIRSSKLIKLVLDVGADNVIITHNHPSGSDSPSIDDIEMTERLEGMLQSVGVLLVDHYIIADEKLISIKQFVAKQEELK